MRMEYLILFWSLNNEQLRKTRTFDKNSYKSEGDEEMSRVCIIYPGRGNMQGARIVVTEIFTMRVSFVFMGCEIISDSTRIQTS